MKHIDDDAVVAATRRWLETVVIGLELCPFAKAVHRKSQIGWIVSHAADDDALLADLRAAMRRLVATPAAQLDTVLLIHPQALADFADYNDFLDAADALLDAEGLTGVLQVASFHPHYRFADSSDDDVANCSNRSPFPMLHLLREDSVQRAVATHPDAPGIPARNVERLRRLGWAGWRRLTGGD